MSASSNGVPTNKILVILGMHRSGTSLIGQWLHQCGLHLGDRLLGADESNSKGHFEDLDFLEYHKDIFRNHQIDDAGLAHIRDFELNRYEENRLKHLILFKNELNPQWGWKEPRTCLFLKSYEKHLSDHKYLVLHRDFNLVVDSLVKREFKRIMKRKITRKPYLKALYVVFNNLYLSHCRLKYADIYLKAWIEYNTQILKHLRTMPTDKYLLVRLDKLEPEKIFDQLKNWGFQLNRTPFQSVYERRLLNSNQAKFTYDEILLNKAQKLQFDIHCMASQ